MSIYFGSVTGFSTILAISTEGFYYPTSCPLWSVFGDASEFIQGSYILGFGLILNVIGILYLAFACITFNFPSVHPITASNINYTCAAVTVVVLTAAVTWLTTGRKDFSGPEAGTNFMEAIHGQLGLESVGKGTDSTNKDQKVSDAFLRESRTPSRKRPSSHVLMIIFRGVR